MSSRLRGRCRGFESASLEFAVEEDDAMRLESCDAKARLVDELSSLLEFFLGRGMPYSELSLDAMVAGGVGWRGGVDVQCVGELIPLDRRDFRGGTARSLSGGAANNSTPPELRQSVMTPRQAKALAPPD